MIPYCIMGYVMKCSSNDFDILTEVNSIFPQKSNNMILLPMKLVKCTYLVHLLTIISLLNHDTIGAIFSSYTDSVRILYS